MFCKKNMEKQMFSQTYYHENTDLTLGKHLHITEPTRHVLNTLLVTGVA